MPTGYTAIVGEGATFEQFVWGCARAFGALIEMRDDSMNAPIPDAFKPHDYNAKRLAEANARLAAVLQMTDAQCAVSAKAEYDKDRAYKIEADKKDVELRAKYEAMIARVNEWEPPSDEHVGLKKFMLQQLNESIRFDCGTSFYREEPTPLTPQEWRTKELEKARRDIVYHTEENLKEIERTDGRNRWIRQLRESVNVPRSQSR